MGSLHASDRTVWSEAVRNWGGTIASWPTFHAVIEGTAQPPSACVGLPIIGGRRKAGSPCCRFS